MKTIYILNWLSKSLYNILVELNIDTEISMFDSRKRNFTKIDSGVNEVLISKYIELYNVCKIR